MDSNCSNSVSVSEFKLTFLDVEDKRKTNLPKEMQAAFVGLLTQINLSKDGLLTSEQFRQAFLSIGLSPS